MSIPTIKELADFTLESYIKLLKYLDQIYEIVPFCKIPTSNTQYLILRHDIDISLPAAYKMAQIERDLNIKSTYFVLFSGQFYNVLEGHNVDILKEISALGHEIGVHYHPAQYSLYKQNAAKTLEIEIHYLEHLLGKKIHSIARHGPWDRDPFAGIKKYNNADHPYFKGDLYIHESLRAWTTIDGLVNLLKGQPQRAQLLVHPENWQEDKIDRNTLLERHFKNLEKKNLLLKQQALEFFKSDQLIIEYDNIVNKGETGSPSITKHENAINHKNKSRLGETLHYYDNLFRHYLINTRLGWKMHLLKTQVPTKFQKRGN